MGFFECGGATKNPKEMYCRRESLIGLQCQEWKGGKELDLVMRGRCSWMMDLPPLEET